MKPNCLIILFLIICFSGYNQTRSELEKQRKNLFEDIRYTNKLLEQNKRKRSSSLSQLAIINQKINLRQKYIYQLESDLETIDNKIIENQIMIESLKEDLSDIKQEYAKLVYYAYRNRGSYDRLVFIFSSEDFNQAYRRLKYLRHYNKYRRKQANSILVTHKIIKQKIDELEIDRQNKSELLVQRRHERNILSEEQNSQKRLVHVLSKKEKELKKELKAKEKLADQLQKQIQQLIAEEMARRKKRNDFELTPEEKLLDDRFASNKSRLPWPTKRGVVTSRFGQHAHPVLKNITVRNDGIDIGTNQGEAVRSIFNGEVRKIFIIPGLNKTVIIRHGKYLTVYSNLIEVFVKVGEKVESKQTIGIVHTDTNEGIGKLKFQVWRENQKLDPEKWLARKK